jgi:hypothetical protein
VHPVVCHKHAVKQGYLSTEQNWTKPRRTLRPYRRNAHIYRIKKYNYLYQKVISFQFQFIYLFTCKLNSPQANYKASTRRTNLHKQKQKQKNDNNNSSINTNTNTNNNAYNINIP